MQELKELILKEGTVIGNDILKVDSFINYQVDPNLMARIGEEFASHFKNKGITKIVTIESSGISLSLMTALSMNIPMVIMKKQPSKDLNDSLLQTQVTSFTTRKEYELCLSPDVIDENDHVLIIDDFLGAIRLLRMAHATIAGIGILIEKSYQPGHDKLVSQGFDVHSLVKIKEMDEFQITFTE